MFIQVNGDNGLISVTVDQPENVPDENWLYEVPKEVNIPLDYMIGNCYLYEALDDMGYQPINKE